MASTGPAHVSCRMASSSLSASLISYVPSSISFTFSLSLWFFYVHPLSPSCRYFHNIKEFSSREYRPPLRNLCFITHQAGTQIYLCMAGDALPIIQQFLWHSLVRRLTCLACSEFHSSSHSCSLKFPMTAFWHIPLQGITSQKGSIKNAFLDMSQGSRRGFPYM